jgi:hypothetical protein
MNAYMHWRRADPAHAVPVKITTPARSPVTIDA